MSAGLLYRWKVQHRDWQSETENKRATEPNGERRACARQEERENAIPKEEPQRWQRELSRRQGHAAALDGLWPPTHWWTPSEARCCTARDLPAMFHLQRLIEEHHVGRMLVVGRPLIRVSGVAALRRSAMTVAQIPRRFGHYSSDRPCSFPRGQVDEKMQNMEFW
jgi:hypothetical protein